MRRVNFLYRVGGVKVWAWRARENGGAKNMVYSSGRSKDWRNRYIYLTRDLFSIS